jgi:hypothetical protein
MLAIIWNLMKKGEENLAPEELELLEVMSALVERFEEENYPISDAPPDRVLRTLVEDRGFKAKRPCGHIRIKRNRIRSG